VVRMPLTVTGAEVVSPARVLVPLDPATARDAVAVVQQTFDATVVEAMTGGKGGPIDNVFTTLAKAHAVYPDRSAMYDEGLPRVPAPVADRADVHLTALAGDDDKPALIVARIDWDVRSADRTVPTPSSSTGPSRARRPRPRRRSDDAGDADDARPRPGRRRPARRAPHRRRRVRGRRPA
jgi:hypothetical protein